MTTPKSFNLLFRKIIVLLASVLSVITLVIIILGGVPWQTGKKFDPQMWKNGDFADKNSMIFDLIESQVLVGKDKQAVVDLIGFPIRQSHSLNETIYYYDSYRDGMFSTTSLKVIFDNHNNKSVYAGLLD